MKKLLFLAVLSMAIAFTACKKNGQPGSGDVKVTAITLNKTSLPIPVGNSEILLYTITPQDASDQTVTWSSSDPTVATITQDGLLTAVKVGNTKITITTTDGNKTATCDVEVLE